MASVPTSTYPGGTPAQYTDALDRLSQLAAGTNNINTHPGLMSALMSAKATPAQAQALNQYMAGVTAQNRMALARVNGAKIDFSDEERNAMNAMGVDYSETDQRTAQLNAVNSGLGVAANGASSSSAPAAPQPQKQDHQGFWSKGILHGVGRIGHNALHNPVTNVMGEGYNLVAASAGGAYSDIQSVEQRLGLSQLDAGKYNTFGLPIAGRKYGGALDGQRRMEMTALGYDPDSFWSNMAFDAHGYSKDDLTPAMKSYDNEGGQGATGWDSNTATIKALQFAQDPKKFQDRILQDSNLTPEQAAQQLQALNSPQFANLVQRVTGSRQTFGAQQARQSGIDPAKNPRAFAAVSGVTDFVASLYIDPTLLLGRVVNGVRKLPLAIDSLNDTDTIAARLDPHLPANQSGARARVITGWQSMIDSTNKIRDSLTEGDTATAAAEYARIQKQTPELVPLVGDFLGSTQGKPRTLADDLGIALSSDPLKAEAGKPITNLHEAVQYISSVGGLQRLASGKAAIESTYMPGAVSRFGFRALRANRAAHVAYADTLRQQRAEAEFLEARQTGSLSSVDQAISDEAVKNADPGVPTHSTVNLKNTRKLMPQADDAVDASSGTVIADSKQELLSRHLDDPAQEAKAETLREHLRGDYLSSASRASTEFHLNEILATEGKEVQPAFGSPGAASAQRATSGDWADNLLPAEKGLVAYNLRRYGTAVAPDGAALGGWASPTAIASRARLAAARFSNLLPINTTFDLASADTANKVRQYARFYLGRGAANSLAAQFANGDLGTRKTIVQGLFAQVAHAAGLGRTDAGRQILKDTNTGAEAYTHVGPGWIVNGKQIALHQGQTATSITLPSFKQLSDASSRVGLYEATAGRLATRTATDNLFNLFRIGILIRPATATRNIIEPYAKALLDGQFGDLLRAKALTYASSDELAAMGQRLGVTEVTGKVPEEVRTAAELNLQQKLATGTKHQVAVARHVLSRVERGDLAAMAGYSRTRIGSQLSDTLAHLTKFYHGALLRTMNPDELRHADELAEVIPQMAHNFGQMVVADRFSPEGATSIRDITSDGLVPQRVNYNLAAGDHPLLDRETVEKNRLRFTRTGFGLETTDNSVGMGRYVNALHARTYASPETAKAVIAALRNPDDSAAVDRVVEALEKENKRGTAFGQYFRPDEEGTAVPAVTDDEVVRGKSQWAHDVINDYRYLLTNQDGQLNDKLLDFIEKQGRTPDEKWFADNLTRSELPARVLAPQYEASPVGGHQMLPQALQDLTGRAFNQIVEGSIKRQSSMPFLAAHYLKARAEQDVAGLTDRMVEAGLSPESARTLQMGQAIRSAYVRTAQMIDDPGQKTQFDIVARNLFMFPRAMQAFIRRWGGSLASDPFKARKMMLALEASEHSGMVYKDQNGELTFTYPGSAVMRDALVAVSKLPGFGGLAKFPVGMDMTGKLMMAAPGFDNPLRFSLSPMVNIPMRTVFSLFPEHQSMWTEIDTALNGSVGASQAHQGILQSLEPSALNKLLAAGSEDERNGVFASAVTGAIAHLSAAGLAPDPSDPPAVQDRFINQVKTQVRNQLYLRFAFGLVAPAAPSNLNENIDNASAKGLGSGTASDYSFNVEGIKNLSSEYKSILDSVSGDVARATSIFIALHPEGLAYTVPATGATANKAYLPATTASLNWMESNLGFLQKYKSVGAYFMPKEQGDFDNNAYQAQLALGLRQKKSISEFYADVQVAQASRTYYDQYDQYQQMRANALAHYDNGGAKTISQAWGLWKSDFLDKHPLLKEKFADTSINKVTGERQIADLQEMIKGGEVPDGLGPQVNQMVTLFNDYLNWKQQVPAGAEGSAQKQAMATAVDAQLGQLAAGDPRLTNLFNAVFRSVDNSLTTVVVDSSGGN